MPQKKITVDWSAVGFLLILLGIFVAFIFAHIAIAVAGLMFSHWLALALAVIAIPIWAAVIRPGPGFIQGVACLFGVFGFAGSALAQLIAIIKSVS